ncbi:hypothetical protein DYB32_006990 [Aphanomyces invadans]|uniref:Uncharacterized protein n=1 Tax=Aphanomyces invadans TaxID=157072 RepID=A0A418APW9_9STRA|nr:hypothetical protein DYB32_006990 [Aphanomyces invadans]
MYELVTCSEDKTVKFWNVMRPRVCQVWRARYTPFGDGLITSFHRQDYFLRLWSLARDSNNSTNAVEPKPVFDFFGHKDLVRGFAWRQQPGGGVFQLISWGKQQELRMWKIDPVLLEACGYVRHQVHHQYLHQHHNSSIDLSTLDEIAVSPYEAPPPQPSASMNGTHGPRPGSHVNLSAYKFDLGCLKADFIPLPLPPPPVSSNGAYEMTHATASATMPVPATQQLVHRHDVMMDVEEWHPGDALTSSKAVLATNGTHGLNADDDPFSSIGRLSTPTNNATVREPIRRVSGGCFSGPNCLVYFDSRVAIGQSKVLHTSSRHLPLPSTTNSTNSILPQTTTPSILSRQFLTATSPSFLWTSAQPPPTFAMTSIGATTPRYNSSSTFVTSTPHHASRSNHVLEATHHFDVAQDDYDELDTNDAGSRTLDTMTGNHHLMQHSPPFPSRRRHPHLSLGPSTATNGGAAPANNPTANGKYLASLDSTLLLRVKILDCSTMCHSHSPPFCHRSPLVTTPAAHAKAAIAAGDVEQGQMWSILAVSTAAAAASPGHLHHENRDMKVDANKFVPTPWHAHPFGSSLVQHVLELFEAAGDVPTLAAIVCAVSLPSAVPPPSPTDQIKNLQSSVLSTVRSTGSTGAPPTSVITTALSSQPQATESMKPTALTTPSTASTPTARRKRASTLLGNTDADVVRYDGYKLAQADLLYRQGATNARCELLKHLQSPSEPHVGLTLAMYCCKCGRPCDELYCNACKGFSVQCAVCELVVRGQSMFCFKCGHGGHSDHIVAWFATEV